MKLAASVLLLAVLSICTTLNAQESTVPAPNFANELSKATLAVYIGKQECGYTITKSFFGDEREWGCEFKSHFTCTATVVGSDNSGNYAGLTAGHCFDSEILGDGFEYYISENVAEKPALRKITIKKFDRSERYDYALFTFHSLKNYPVIAVDMTDAFPIIGTKVLNVNFSYGLTKQIIEGPVVSNVIERSEGNIAGVRRRVLIQLPVGPGASGSPVVDESTHEIVGLVEGIFPGTQMPAVIIPTGNNFLDFLEDDSAGLKSKSEPEKVEINKVPVEQTKPSIWFYIVSVSILIGYAVVHFHLWIKNGFLKLSAGFRNIFDDKNKKTLSL